MAHVLNWFEIPVTDFPRAQRFYEAVLGFKIEPFVMGPMTMGMLGTDHESVGGAIVQGEGGQPAQTGTLVYLNGGDDLARRGLVGFATGRKAEDCDGAGREDDFACRGHEGKLLMSQLRRMGLSMRGGKASVNK